MPCIRPCFILLFDGSHLTQANGVETIRRRLETARGYAYFCARLNSDKVKSISNVEKGFNDQRTHQWPKDASGAARDFYIFPSRFLLKSSSLPPSLPSFICSFYYHSLAFFPSTFLLQMPSWWRAGKEEATEEEEEQEEEEEEEQEEEEAYRDTQSRRPAFSSNADYHEIRRKISSPICPPKTIRRSRRRSRSRRRRRSRRSRRSSSSWDHRRILRVKS